MSDSMHGIQIEVTIKYWSDGYVRYVAGLLEKQGFRWSKKFGISPIMDSPYAAIRGLAEEDQLENLRKVEGVVDITSLECDKPGR